MYDSWFVVTACHEALAGWKHKDLHFYPPPMRRLVIPRKRSFQDSFAAQFNWKLWMVSDFYFFRVDIFIFNSTMSKKLVAEFENISLSRGLISNKIKCPHHSCARGGCRQKVPLFGLKDGHFWQKWPFSDHKKWHFEWPNRVSKTTFIVEKFPKYLSLLGAILAIFQFCWLIWNLDLASTHSIVQCYVPAPLHATYMEWGSD